VSPLVKRPSLLKKLEATLSAAASAEEGEAEMARQIMREAGMDGGTRPAGRHRPLRGALRRRG